MTSMVSTRGLYLHSMMYGLNVYSEVRALRKQYKENKYAVFFFSKAVSNIALFIEFFFEILNERCEPLILVFESFKSFLSFIEYKSLIEKENIKVYININSYKEFKAV